MKNSILRNLLLCAILLLASGCTVAMPFHSSNDFNQPGPPDATVAIGLTHAVLGDDDEKNDIFWDNADKVVDSLLQQAGYLGHRLRFKILGGEVWTMTVWKDEQSLKNFMYCDAHHTAIQEGFAALKYFQVATITVKRSEVQISWDRAEQILREQGHRL